MLYCPNFIIAGVLGGYVGVCVVCVTDRTNTLNFRVFVELVKPELYYIYILLIIYTYCRRESSAGVSAKVSKKSRTFGRNLN